MIANKPLRDVTREDLQALIDNKVYEGRTLEFKRDIVQDLKELARDVAAFANAGGGDMIFGIDEARDEANKQLGYAGKLVGIQESFDQAKQRIEHGLPHHIEPRVQGLQFAHIDGFESGVILLMRVPRSWSGPHLVRHEKARDAYTFFTRTNSGRQAMDVQELRAAFLGGLETAARIRQFRDGRLGRIVADELPVALHNGPKVVLHVVPLAEHPLDPRALRRGPTVLRPFISPANWTYTFNVDGIVSASYDVSYCQAFRNGALEAVSAEFGSSEQLFADPIEHDVLRTLSHCLDVLAANGYLGPVSVMLALANVKGSKLTYGKDYGRGEKHRFDRDVITLPDLVLETTARPDLPRELKSLFDAMWQAAGYERSHGYDEAGVWLNEANGS